MQLPDLYAIQTSPNFEKVRACLRQFCELLRAAKQWVQKPPIAIRKLRWLQPSRRV